jgi:8-oxo-dGTP pyrophosphatase MutT (NUDIX family)
MSDTGDSSIRPRIVRPVDAAGLVLIRKGRHGAPEVLLGRRHMRAGFLPDIYVVPGGRVDSDDNRSSGFAERMHPAVARMLDSGGRRRPVEAFLRAALRETYEETGLLVGRPLTTRQADSQGAGPTDQAIWQAYAAAGLRPDLADLDFLLRAITPVTSRRRYNTRFFLADGGMAVGDIASNGELEDLGWRRKADLDDLNIVDVTHAVLAEAFRRWENRLPIGTTKAKLLNYKKDIMTLSRHRDRSADPGATSPGLTSGA